MDKQAWRAWQETDRSNTLLYQ